MMAARRVLLVLTLAAILSAGTTSFADEVLRFKNGHSLTVRSTHVEGNLVHVVMPDGAQASFPTALIKPSESGTLSVPGSVASGPVNFAGRGPRGSDLFGSRRAEVMAAMNGSTAARQRVLAEGTLNSQGGTVRQTVGFSQWGSAAIGVPNSGLGKPGRVSVSDPLRENAKAPTPERGDESVPTAAPGTRPAEPAVADPSATVPGVL